MSWKPWLSALYTLLTEPAVSPWKIGQGLKQGGYEHLHHSEAKYLDLIGQNVCNIFI